MEEFEGFPKKVLIGNFSQDVIIERCKGLSRFLNFIHKEGVLSRTAVFSKFLYHSEVKATNDYLLQSQFNEACPILENTYVLLDSLQWDTGLILRTLCQLVVCLYAIGSYQKAHTYSTIALAKFHHSPTNRKIGRDLYLPLLVFCDNLWGVLGKDRCVIRARLEAARKHNTGRRCDEVTPNLLDKLRDDIALRTLH
ncbi:hypothetical protein Pcinc_026187 [Petrolisthes cinctipes]|uniref:PX domain-containing protein n=1 Tax=Petrolisthes cinctipes TaxID=88211 RepID=A0AAE1KC03_PETCI|nr:hypothetical protein Pcinc_026187 [Petrolisthes cinctipes]